MAKYIIKNCQNEKKHKTSYREKLVFHMVAGVVVGGCWATTMWLLGGCDSVAGDCLGITYGWSSSSHSVLAGQEVAGVDVVVGTAVDPA